MFDGIRLSRLGLLAPLLLGPAAGCQGPAQEAQDSWLKGSEEEKFHEVESQLRGLDITMMEVGYRFTELYFAGKDRNWPYAKYQAEKIDHVIRLGIERRPKRVASAEPFLAEEIPAILRIIEEQSKLPIAEQKEVVFHQGMERLRSACMKCHVAEQVQDFMVELPERRLSPIRRAPR